MVRTRGGYTRRNILGGYNLKEDVANILNKKQQQKQKTFKLAIVQNYYILKPL